MYIHVCTINIKIHISLMQYGCFHRRGVKKAYGIKNTCKRPFPSFVSSIQLIPFLNAESRDYGQVA